MLRSRGSPVRPCLMSDIMAEAAEHRLWKVIDINAVSVPFDQF
jgi:hypothetical protein